MKIGIFESLELRLGLGLTHKNFRNWRIRLTWNKRFAQHCYQCIQKEDQGLFLNFYDHFLKKSRFLTEDKVGFDETTGFESDIRVGQCVIFIPNDDNSNFICPEPSD